MKFGAEKLRFSGSSLLSRISSTKFGKSRAGSPGAKDAQPNQSWSDLMLQALTEEESGLSKVFISY